MENELGLNMIKDIMYKPRRMRERGRLKLGTTEKDITNKGFKKMGEPNNYCKYFAKDRRIHIKKKLNGLFYYHIDNH